MSLDIQTKWNALTDQEKMERTEASSVAMADRRFALLMPEYQQAILDGTKVITNWNPQAD